MCKELLYNPELLDRLPGRFLLVVTGPTASGKDFTLDALEQCVPGLKRINSITTRPVEHYGGNSDYTHLDPDTFCQLGDGLVAVTARIIDGVEYYYGTRRESLDLTTEQNKRLVWKLDIATAATLPGVINNAFEPDRAQEILSKSVVICLGYPSLQTVRQRYFARKRNDCLRDRFKIRLQDEWQMWQNYGDQFQHIVLNTGTIDQTVASILELIAGMKSATELG